MANTAFNDEISYMTLFPETEFNNIIEAYSVYGAGAFFVALMDIAANKISKVPAGLGLKDRRPDLWELSITQDNLDKESPYLERANSILTRTLFGKKEAKPDKRKLYGNSYPSYTQKQVLACLQTYQTNLCELTAFFSDKFNALVYSDLIVQHLALLWESTVEQLYQKDNYQHLKMWEIIANKLSLSKSILMEYVSTRPTPIEAFFELQTAKNRLNSTPLSLAEYVLLLLLLQKNKVSDSEQRIAAEWVEITSIKLKETQSNYKIDQSKVAQEDIHELLFQQWAHELAVFLGIKDHDVVNLLKGIGAKQQEYLQWLPLEDGLDKLDAEEVFKKYMQPLISLAPYLILVDKLNLDDASISWVGEHVVNSKEDPITKFLCVAGLSKLMSALPIAEDKEKLLACLSGAKTTEDNLEKLCRLFEWSLDDAKELAYPGQSTLQIASKLFDCFEKSRTLNLDVKIVNELVTQALEGVEVTLYTALQESNHAQHNRFRPYWGEVLELERDILVDLVIEKLKEDFEDINTTDHLSDYLLVDVNISGLLNITPVREATDAIQTYLMRCKNGLEKPAINGISQEQWDWIPNFRLWQAEQKLRVFPENYMQEEMPENASPLFKKLLSALQQQDLDNKIAETAMLNYLDEFVDIANAKIVAEYHEGDIQIKVAKHLVKEGTFLYCTNNGKGFSPWEEIPTRINVETLSCIWAFHRIYIFWNELTSLKDTDPSDKDKKLTVHQLTTKAIYQNIDDTWSTPITIEDTFPFYIETENGSSSFGWGNGDCKTIEEEVKKKFDSRLDVWKRPRIKFDSDKIIVCNGPVWEDMNKRFRTWLKDGKSSSEHIVKLDSLIYPSDDLQKNVPWIVFPPKALSDSLQTLPFKSSYHADYAGLKFPDSITQPNVEALNRIRTVAHEKGMAFIQGVVHSGFGEAYQVYQREMFFYAPMLIAKVLSRNCKFDEARKWYHYVFNPIGINPEQGLEAFKFLKRCKLTTSFYALEKVPVTYEKNNLVKFELENGEEVKTDLRGDPNLKHQYYLLRDKPNQRYVFVADNGDLFIAISEDNGRKWVEDYVSRSPVFEKNIFGSYTGALFIEGDENRNWVLKKRTDLSKRFRRLSKFELHPYQIQYGKWAATAYIRFILDFADHQFRQSTWESISTATQLYFEAEDLLGQRPMVVDTLADFKKNENSRTFGNTKFALPTDISLEALWSTVSDRLTKIRNGRNINGERQMPSMYGSPIDPARLLVAAQHGGINPYDASNLSVEKTHYRFRDLAPHTEAAIHTVVEFGGQLYNALTQKDHEQLQVLQATHQVNMQNLLEQTYLYHIEEAAQELQNLKKNKESAELQRDHYQSLITQNMLPEEQNALGYLQTIQSLQTWSYITRFGASPLHLLPNTFGLANGGMQFGSSVESVATALSEIAQEKQTWVQISQINAEYKRRSEEWKFQQESAQKSLEQAEIGIAAAQIRLDIAKEGYKQYLLQAKQAAEIWNYFNNKFTNVELYNWISGQMASLYFSAYNLALSSLHNLQKAYHYELDEEKDNFIPSNAWNSLKKGLLAGETLKLALARMNDAYLNKNVRRQEIEKIISLKQLLNGTWENDKKNGSLKFNLDKAALKIANSDSRILKIKSIAVSIPAVLGPYETFGATLTHTQTGQVITISRGIDDMGVFPEEMNDGRYLPFEGIKLENEASGDWVFAVDKTIAAKISDVILTVKITAK